MTTEQFRDYFVGEKGFDTLKKLMKNGNELSVDLAKCWQERYDHQIAYSKGLRKNSEAFQKLAARSKGSLAQAFSTIATQTNIESDAHNLVANTLWNKICVPMKNLADTQLKGRKPIEDALNGKFKIWKDKKELDNKYRQRQFENCKEIEGLYLKMDEIPKTTKQSVKECSKEVPLITACVFSTGRHTSFSEKSADTPLPSSSSSSSKHASNMEMSLRKVEQELEKTEKKYHEATKDVELARQHCDVEMCRCCDQMQTMELDRLNEMEKFIQLYSTAIQTLNETMSQVKQELYAIRITPEEDIIMEAKSNVTTLETEILLYDIYAENEHHAMSQERRVLSLLNWMQMLRQDIEIQRRSKDAEMIFPLKSREQAFRDNTSDGAMCSTVSHSRTDMVVHGEDHQDGSSSDDDGAMHRHRKRGERKKQEGIQNLSGFCKQNQNFSTGVNASDVFFRSESVRLLQCLYEGSLYKIEKMYNQLKHLPEPHYEHSQRFAKSFTDKGIATTFLRLPFQALSESPPSAPASTTSRLARSVPVVATPTMVHQPAAPPPPYSAHQPTPIGWAVNGTLNDHVTTGVYPMYNRAAAPGPPYPVLPNAMTASTDSLRQQRLSQVKVLHAYEARHDDELTIRPGEIITLLERRSDQWYKGRLNGNVGLFPGNFVQDI